MVMKQYFTAALTSAVLLAPVGSIAGTATADGIFDYTQLNEFSNAFDTPDFPDTGFGEASFITFPEAVGTANYTYTFDNQWFAGTGLRVHRDYVGNIATTFETVKDDGSTVSAFQSSGSRLTQGNDFAPSAYGSGQFYEAIGRGNHSFNCSSCSTEDAEWVITFDFTSLAKGFLPIGSLLSIIDSGEGEESMDITATLSGSIESAWMNQIDFWANGSPQSQPAPTFTGGSTNLYEVSDVASNDQVIAGGGGGHVLMATTQEVTSLSFRLTQGLAGGSQGFEFMAPVEPVPLPAGLPMLLAGVGVFALMRRKSA